METHNDLKYYNITNFHPVSTGAEHVYKHQMSRNFKEEETLSNRPQREVVTQ